MTGHLRTAILLAAEELGELQEVKRGGGQKGYRWAKGPGGLVGYLRWLGRYEPRSMAALLGRVLPYQIVAESAKSPGSEEMTREEMVAELRARGIPVERIFSDAEPMKVINHDANEPTRKQLVKRGV